MRHYDGPEVRHYNGPEVRHHSGPEVLVRVSARCYLGTMKKYPWNQKTPPNYWPTMMAMNSTEETVGQQDGAGSTMMPRLSRAVSFVGWKSEVGAMVVVLVMTLAMVVVVH